MTDMRATERLLEVIQELVREASSDTLVRRDDLRLVLPKASAWVDRISDPESIPRFTRAIDRLENALGGKMR